jgi:xanthine dehydrogenase YagS FAD-binding subunit
MAHPSDMAPALVALKATAVIAGVDGERKIPLRDFFAGPESFRETNLKSDEFLLAIEVPDQPGGSHQVFLKHRIRHAADFALASVAVVARISDGVCDEMSIVLGGVAPLPYEAVDTQRSLKGKRLTGQLISDAAETCMTEARPLPMNGYKVDLTKALVRNVLRSIAETPNG